MILDLLAMRFGAFELENYGGYDTSLDSLATISLIIKAHMHQFYMDSVRDEAIKKLKVPLLLPINDCNETASLQKFLNIKFLMSKSLVVQHHRRKESKSSRITDLGMQQRWLIEVANKDLR